MKLLFAEQLAASLTRLLADLFPGSEHVSTLGMEGKPDEQIWKFAQVSGFTIVTKDKDFANLSVVWGSPPKVIFLRVGNCKVSDILILLQRHAIAISDFHQSQRSVLVLTGR